MLELQLTPYDMLRLRQATGETSSALLEKYIIEEQEPGEPFPRFYLTMVDDGRASCIFVGPEGCRVYSHRPSACRTYPVGRGVARNSDNSVVEQFILLREPHCLGFNEEQSFTAESYAKDQELDKYNSLNDALLPLLQHHDIQDGFVPSRKQVELFTLALFDLDTFRKKIAASDFETISSSKQHDLENASDEELLIFSIGWLQKELFFSTC